MDNWDPSVVYQMATERHQENIARGKAAQRQAGFLGTRSARLRLADALIALAARLDPMHLGVFVRENSTMEAQA